MLTAFRWMVRLVTGLVVLTLLIGWGMYYILSLSLPDYN